MKRILVTGGAGFIGSHFIKHLLNKQENINVINLDKLTYAGNTERLKEFEIENRYHFVNDDICNQSKLNELFSKGIDIVVHFAAESHVDKSIEDAFPFEHTNIRGTLTLLEESRKACIKKFIHISTDEVYGEIKEGQFFENSPLNPNSPYSASKASGDMLVRAYIKTYKLPAIIIRPSNNYGPGQYPEKLIPVVISKAIKNGSIPVYAKGLNVREWLYVEDCVKAIEQVMKKGKVGEIYNLGSGQELKNLDLVIKILSLLNKPQSLIQFVEDRPGHDFRYSLNSEKIKKEIGWDSKIDFHKGIEETIKWYIENESWWNDKIYS